MLQSHPIISITSAPRVLFSICSLRMPLRTECSTGSSALSQKRGADIHDVLAPPTLFLGQLRPSHVNRLDTPWGQPTAATTSAGRVPPVKAGLYPYLGLDTGGRSQKLSPLPWGEGSGDWPFSAMLVA